MYVPREQRMLDQYLQEIGKIDLLEPEEEVEQVDFSDFLEVLV
jgi:RNA polymerase primary sigma factor